MDNKRVGPVGPPTQAQLKVDPIYWIADLIWCIMYVPTAYVKSAHMKHNAKFFKLVI